jgi:hypothetical protein
MRAEISAIKQEIASWLDLNLVQAKQLLDEAKEVREFRRGTDAELDEISITKRPTATPFALGICVVLANNGQPV